MAPFRSFIGLALLASACATNSSVKRQVDPLGERISKLEQQQADLQAQQTTTAGKLADLSSAVQALRSDLATTNAAAQNAQQAAAEARAATARAETAAKKAAKAFELQQKKGR
jgi:chromosome segregation ATPase